MDVCEGKLDDAFQGSATVTSCSSKLHGPAAMCGANGSRQMAKLLRTEYFVCLRF